MKPTATVAISSPSFSKNTQLMAELAQLGVAVVANTDGIRYDERTLGRFLRDSGASVAIIGLETLNGRVLDECPNIRFVAKYGVGLDNIDQGALKQRGIGLGWTGGVNKRSVSELALCFMLGHMRNVMPSVSNMKASNWHKDGGRHLSDATVGIVGLGHVGFDLAGLLQPFGCRVLYTDILDCAKKVGSLSMNAVGYQELLRESDVISFHVPLTETTRHMFGAREIERCRSDVLVINTARGEVVDFETVCLAVKDKKLGGFGCDVFPVEPCDLKKWGGEPNLYFTPHIGGNAREAVLAMGRSAIGHVKAHIFGN